MKRIKYQGHLPNKRLGQHFLHDAQIIEKLCHEIAPTAAGNLRYVEIGPGLGALTWPLLERVDDLILIEFDRRLANRLREHPKYSEKCKLYSEDILKFDFGQLKASDKGLCMVGNLPYNIATQILCRLFTADLNLKSIIVMLQKEVALRLVSAPGSKQYGRLSVMAQYHCHCEALFDVSPNAFTPPPAVESTVVKLVPRTLKLPLHSLKSLEVLCRVAFQKRRKTLQNALSELKLSNPLIELGIDPQWRPEQLALEDFCRIANQVQLS